MTDKRTYLRSITFAVARFSLHPRFVSRIRGGLSHRTLIFFGLFQKHKPRPSLVPPENPTHSVPTRQSPVEDLPMFVFGMPPVGGACEKVPRKKLKENPRQRLIELLLKAAQGGTSPRVTSSMLPLEFCGKTTDDVDGVAAAVPVLVLPSSRQQQPSWRARGVWWWVSPVTREANERKTNENKLWESGKSGYTELYQKFRTVTENARVPYRLFDNVVDILFELYMP